MILMMMPPLHFSVDFLFPFYSLFFLSIFVDTASVLVFYGGQSSVDSFQGHDLVFVVLAMDWCRLWGFSHPY